MSCLLRNLKFNDGVERVDSYKPDNVTEFFDNEVLKSVPAESLFHETNSKVKEKFKPGSEIYEGLHLANADRLGIAAQVGGSGIKASIVTRDRESQEYFQHDVKISNEHGRGVHVLFDIFATVSKAAVGVAEVVSNLSWAGSHRADVEEGGKLGLWNHTNFNIEGYQDSNGNKEPIDIGELLKSKLLDSWTQGEGAHFSHNLLVKNGLAADYKSVVNGRADAKSFKLRVLHDPHSSLLHGARTNHEKIGLAQGDNYGVLIGGTGNNIWLGEGWNPEKGEFDKYHQTRFGAKPNMFTLPDWDEYGKDLEPFRFDEYLRQLKTLSNKGLVSKEQQEKLYDHLGRAELWFTGGQNDNPNAGIKATFNHIRKLILIAKEEEQSSEISKEQAKKQLNMIFEKLSIHEYDRLEMISGVHEHPVLKQKLDGHNWVQIVNDAKDDLLVRALKLNLLSRFTNVMAGVLNKYKSVMDKFKGFVIHGGYIKSLFSATGHDLRGHFTGQLNSKLGFSGDSRLKTDNIIIHDPYLDGAYRLTLEDISKQQAA